MDFGGGKFGSNVNRGGTYFWLCKDLQARNYIFVPNMSRRGRGQWSAGSRYRRWRIDRTCQAVPSWCSFHPMGWRSQTPAHTCGG